MAKIPNSFSIFSSKILKEKQLEERFERKDRVRSPCENNLNRSAGLNGNCTTPSSCEFGKKVCLDALSDWWAVEPEAEVKTAQSRVTKIQWQR